MKRTYIITEENKTDIKKFKVGATRNPKNRLTDLQTGNPNKLNMIIGSENNIETKLKQKLNEIFVPINNSSASEWYEVPAESLNEYNELIRLAKIEKLDDFLK